MSKLRETEFGHVWYCPACDELHAIPKSWVFNDNFQVPTFAPSVMHQKYKWPRIESPQKEGMHVCHYFVTNGKVLYQKDCTHDMAGKTIDMPQLPPEYRNA